MGVLDTAGIGCPVEVPENLDCQQLRSDCKEHNEKLLATLKEDAHSAELYQLTVEDAMLSRMSMPVPVEQCNLEECLLHPRFAVDQGIRWGLAAPVYHGRLLCGVLCQE